MDDEQYCRKHDRVSTPHYHQISCRDLFGISRSSSPTRSPTSIRTIDRAWITTTASSAKKTLMMKMSCGIT